MDELRLISDQLLEQNKPRRNEMLDLICSRESIAFVGAGLSASPSLNYPTWAHLIRKTLFEAANGIAPFSFSDGADGNLLLMADEIWNHFESNQGIADFKSVLGHAFGPRNGTNCSSTHERLVKLPFKAFVTTNYDDCLTCALGDWRAEQGLKQLPGVATDIKVNGEARHTLSAFLRSLSAPFDQSRRHVVHLHGRHDDPSSIILTSSQYYRAYGFETRDGQRTNEMPRTTIHRQLAWALLATRKLVFLGCSMDDPYITELLKIVATDLWESWRAIHFVVLPLDQQSVASAHEQVNAFKQYGLQVVFYDNWDGTFIKLDQLLELAYAQKPPDEANRALSELPKTVPNASYLLGSQQKKLADVPQIKAIPLSWLDEINSFTSKDLKRE